jgi:hypothetical protein
MAGEGKLAEEIVKQSGISVNTCQNKRKGHL